MVAPNSSPEFSPELYEQLRNRPRPDDKEGAIELYYELLSSGNSVGQILSTLGRLSGPGDVKAAGNSAAFDCDTISPPGSNPGSPTPEEAPGVYGAALPDEAKLRPVLPNSSGPRQSFVTGRAEPTVTVDETIGRNSDRDGSREEDRASSRRGVPKKVAFWALFTAAVVSGSIACVSVIGRTLSVNGIVEQGQEPPVAATAEIVGSAEGVPRIVSRKPLTKEASHNSGALVSTELAAESAPVQDARAAPLPLSEAAQHMPMRVSSATRAIVALARTGAEQPDTVSGELTANAAQERSGRGGAMGQKLQYRSVNVAPDLAALYPASIFSHEQRTPDGLMAVLRNDNRTAILTISKGGNKGNAPASVRKFYEELENAKVTYFLDRRNFFVISGIKKVTSGEDLVFYLKRVLLTDEYAEIELQYPVSQKALYDPIAEQVSKSFVKYHRGRNGSFQKPDRPSQTQQGKPPTADAGGRAHAPSPSRGG